MGSERTRQTSVVSMVHNDVLKLAAANVVVHVTYNVSLLATVMQISLNEP